MLMCATHAQCMTHSVMLEAGLARCARAAKPSGSSNPHAHARDAHPSPFDIMIVTQAVPHGMHTPRPQLRLGQS